MPVPGAIPDFGKIFRKLPGAAQHERHDEFRRWQPDKLRTISFSNIDDNSAEAIVARMEAALRDGQLGRALGEAKALNPGLASHAQAWLTRAEARQSVDNAIAAVEGQLKASLAGVSEPADKSKN